jgi:hypothetical protein
MKFMQTLRARIGGMLAHPLAFIFLVWVGLFILTWACFALTDWLLFLSGSLE